MGNKSSTGSENRKRSRSFNAKTKRNNSMVIPKSSILTTRTTPIENDYVMLKPVGEGMNGKVYLCQNKLDKKKYALKKLIDDKNSRREIELQWRSSLNCKYIVAIKDVYENKVGGKRYLYVVMEYMEGGELFDMLKRKKHFTENEAAKIMYQICQAVSHLHTMGISHRDLKPENLLLQSKSENSLIKLSDFGFAKEAHKGLVTPNFTPYYVAPEVLSFEKYDISCDIWSMGVIMYILCCGYPPFYSTHGEAMSPGMKKRIKLGQYDFPQADWANVSEEAKALISRMLETVPEKRLNINDIMRSSWIKNYANAPKTRLNSIKVLKKDKENWKDYLDNMNKALEEMRINYNRTIKLKEISISNNALLERRLKRASVKNTAGVNLDMTTTDDDESSNNKVEIQSRKSRNLQESDGLLIESRKASGVKLNRMKSMPAEFSPLTALYYSSAINELDQERPKTNLFE